MAYKHQFYRPSDKNYRNIENYVPLVACKGELSTSAPRIHPRMSDPFPAVALLNPLFHTQNAFLFPQNKRSSRCKIGRCIDRVPVVGLKRQADEPAAAIALWTPQTL